MTPLDPRRNGLGAVRLVLALMALMAHGWRLPRQRPSAAPARPPGRLGGLRVGAVLPVLALLRRHDISYGMDVDAFPVRQLRALTGVGRLGLVRHGVAVAVATVPLAARAGSSSSAR